MTDVITTINEIGAPNDILSKNILNFKFHHTAGGGPTLSNPRMRVSKTHSMLITLVKLLARQAAAEYWATAHDGQIRVRAA